MDSRRTPQRPRVVVTGLGAVSAAGWGVAPFREMLRSGRTKIGPFDRFDHTRQRTHIAGQVPPSPRPISQDWKRLSNSDRFALYAALEAVKQSGLELPLTSAGIFFGGSTGGLFESENYFEALCRADGRPRRAMLASHGLSAPAETVARHLGVQGPVETVSSACASGGLAIEQALRSLRDGEVDLAVAGGADCLCLTTYSGFNALRAVDERACRPFRGDRAGLSLGEGGAALILETLGHAQSRGAVPLAEVAGAGSSCDAHHMTAPQAEGAGAAVAIEEALRDAGLDRSTIDFVNAHGTGTPLNDAAESAALMHAFGDRVSHLPLEATKAFIGHLLGAAGVIEAVATVLSMMDGEVHGAPGGGAIDPALPVDLVLDRARQMQQSNVALSTSFGFGGANAGIILRRWEAA